MTEVAEAGPDGAAAAGRGAARGLRELASDADLADAVGRAAHLALGFVGTERVVFFRRALAAAA